MILQLGSFYKHRFKIPTTWENRSESQSDLNLLRVFKIGLHKCPNNHVVQYINKINSLALKALGLGQNYLKQLFFTIVLGTRSVKLRRCCLFGLIGFISLGSSATGLLILFTRQKSFLSQKLKLT